jgi:hypothetical protein
VKPLGTAVALAGALSLLSACDSKKDPVATGREAVKEVVTEPFKTLEGAKDSLKQSEDKAKAALEAIDQEAKQ